MRLAFIILLTLLLAADILAFFHAKKVSLYRFRCIAYASAIPALLFLLLSAAAERLGWASRAFWEMAPRWPGRFAQISVVGFSLLCLFMAISNVELVRREGMAVKNVVGTLLELIFILGTLAVYVLVRFAERAGLADVSPAWSFIARFLPMYLYLLIDYCECIILGTILMGWIAAGARPSYDKDFIIIPGCSIRKDGGLLPLLRGRVNRAMRYAWEQEIATGRPCAFIPSGGQGEDEIMSEGSAMALYLLSHSAEENEVFPEKQSANTRENFLFSKRIVDSLKPDARVAFATTNYHVLRCGMLSRMVGLDAEGIASSTKWYFWPNGFARETVAIFSLTRKIHFASAAVLAVLAAILTLL